MQQVLNPFLPFDTYIADGEPHVFGDRVYLFGSHDQANANTYCTLGYEIFSAPVDHLTEWTSRGINYHADQDPLAESTNRHYLYAPDCMQGKDGRFYLYYSLSGEKGKGGYNGPISVAVCDTPDGKYEFYHHVQNRDGSFFADHVVFDPAVINDSGRFRLYYGTFYPFHTLPRICKPLMWKIQSSMFGVSASEIKAHNDDIMGPCMVELEEDMFTVKTKVKRILPVYDSSGPFSTTLSIIPKDGHFLTGHGFFEGSSMRKVEDTYYFIYSSMNNHELCYATSKFPDHGFVYGGVIVSGGDVGFQGRKEKDRLNYTATNHGSIEQINGQWYVFYHRQTHGSDYSRQACAEKINFDSQGRIQQAEITSCGLNCGDLKGKGPYPASCCCNLANGRMPHGSNAKRTNIPMVFSDTQGQYIRGMNHGTVAVYKYFDLTDTNAISVIVRGCGVFSILVNSVVQCGAAVNHSEWQVVKLPLKGENHAVLSVLCTKGKIDIRSFTLK